MSRLLGLELYHTIVEQATTGSSVGGANFSGGPHQSLGGTISLTPLPTLYPPVTPSSAQGARFGQSNVAASYHRVYKDVTATILTAGATLYRGLMLKYSDEAALTDLELWLTQPVSGTTIKIKQETPVSRTITRVANETTSPGGSFTSPTDSSRLAGPTDFEEDDLLGLWFEHTITAGTAAYSWDYWGLHVTADDYEVRSWYFYQHLLKGVTIASVASSLTSGANTYAGKGETFTVTMSGPTDPASNKVLVFLNGPQFFSGGVPDAGLPGVVTLVDQCDRSSAGVYTYQWRPEVPGFYTVEFNIGEDFYRLNRNVLP